VWRSVFMNIKNLNNKTHCDQFDQRKRQCKLTVAVKLLEWL
jgi:hypothetical protein